MRNNIFLLMILFAFCACRTSKPLTSESVTHSVEYIIKDSIIKEPGDTVNLTTVLPCPDAKWSGEVKGSKTTLTASLENGVLNIDCHTDSLIKKIQWLEKQSKTERQIVITNEVKVPVKYTPKWVWYLMAISIGLAVYTFRKQIFPLVGKLFKLFT